MINQDDVDFRAYYVECAKEYALPVIKINLLNVEGVYVEEQN